MEKSEPNFGLVGIAVGVFMGLGAIFAALNTMYSAVSARTREIATLRAIGFGAASVVVSVLVEALLLALIGAVIGAAIAWLLFNGNTVTLGDSVSSMVFKMQVGPALLGRRAARLRRRLHRRPVSGRACGSAAGSDGVARGVGAYRAAALVAARCSCCASSSIWSIAAGRAAMQRALQEPRADERRQPEVRLHLHEVRDARAFAFGRERPLGQRVFEVAAFRYGAGSNKLRRDDFEALDAAHASAVQQRQPSTRV